MIVYVKKKEAGSTCCNPQQVTYGVLGIIQIEENVLDIRRTWGEHKYYRKVLLT